MQFIYVLPGWEGSAHDDRVLRDAMIRSNGLKVPQGCYYLVDAGYCNADGFLAPFRGQRYHLNEFHGHRPHTAEEYFNMKHSKARNVIQRCFGLLKGRWKILASPSFFPIETQVRIVLACCLLHNLTRKYMSFDPQELEPLEEDDMEDEHFEDDECVTSITPTEEWTNFRNTLALEMQSGCQWNDVEKKIACEKQWFDSYCQTHKEAKGMWDFKFPYLNQLELVYERDRAIGSVAQGYVDAIYNLEVDQNDESGDKNLREKMTSERMKDVIAELMNLSLPSGDVFKAANIFTADKDKIDVLFNLPSELRRNYVKTRRRRLPSGENTKEKAVVGGKCEGEGYRGENVKKKVAVGRGDAKKTIEENEKEKLPSGENVKEKNAK
ncbi:hypothetical protein ZIOFF_010286 [Zingiber officinale]|uniref:DDE Tnp4 domain-containing protein n=1 Tax=Zingiber officinale TaxID=94328 RepID=A0A8J5LY66_ZINOF|nr:hypothetical protein ZIOFF_010286 [Zingiber officinale]